MYSELCEKLFEQNANNYVALFNELDKYFDKLIGGEKFMPFNEKLKEIIKAKLPISLFVKKYETKLKYFGELRNHIAHGFKIEGQHYAIPSYHAVDELNKIKDAIMKPMTVSSLFSKAVYTCLVTDTLKEVMTTMKNFRYTHVPVYDANHSLKGVINNTILCDRLPNHLTSGMTMETILVGDIDLALGGEKYEVVDGEKPLFSIPGMFEHTPGINQKKLGAILITENGDEASHIVGIITSSDLPVITQQIFLSTT